MTNSIKVGDTVKINTNICMGFGRALYEEAGIHVGQTYTVTGLKPDKSDYYNARYGGYIELADVEEGFYVMEDFEVVEAGV